MRFKHKARVVLVVIKSLYFIALKKHNVILNEIFTEFMTAEENRNFFSLMENIYFDSRQIHVH